MGKTEDRGVRRGSTGAATIRTIASAMVMKKRKWGGGEYKVKKQGTTKWDVFKCLSVHPGSLLSF